MEIKSLVFNEGAKIPGKYTCEGSNLNPPLQFINPPSGTRSFALIMEDANEGNVHWLIYNIPGDTKEISEGNSPKGSILGLCDDGTYGYDGPTPSIKEKSYVFKLFALDMYLDAGKKIDKKLLYQRMKKHILSEASISCIYKRHQTEKAA